MIEGDMDGITRIKSKKTLGEILEVAASFEEAARDFFTDLIPKVTKNFRWLVEELAQEEHYDLFAQMRSRADIAEQIMAEVSTPVTDGRFSTAAHIPDLGESPDDQAVLQYALGREHLAMQHHRELAQSAEPGPIKALFEFLANEEASIRRSWRSCIMRRCMRGGVRG